MLEPYKTLHPKPKNSDGLKKVLQLNMRPAAEQLNQQGHTQLHKETSRLCESWGGHFDFALK